MLNQKNETRMAARQFAVEMTEEDIGAISGAENLLQVVTATMCDPFNGVGAPVCYDSDVC